MPSKLFRNAEVTISNTNELSNVNTEKIRYYIFARYKTKISESPYLKGYVEFKQGMSKVAITQAFGVERLRVENRTDAKDVVINNYLEKDEEAIIFGAPGKSGRPRSSSSSSSLTLEDELATLKEMISEGKTIKQICRLEPVLYCKHTKYINAELEFWKEDQQQAALSKWVETIVLNERQLELDAAVEAQTDRQVTWIEDEIGKTGKSFWSRYKFATMGALRIENANTKDIAYAYDGESLVIMDLSRTNEVKVNYDAIERLKNGMMFSSKYKSKAKLYVKCPKLVVLANFAPDFSKLSQDRWDYRKWVPEPQQLQEQQQQ